MDYLILYGVIVGAVLTAFAIQAVFVDVVENFLRN